MAQPDIFDVVIIGGGPAGLSAGIYTCRAKLNTILLEKLAVGGQLLLTKDVANYPGFPELVAGPELMEMMEKQARSFGLQVEIEEARGIAVENSLKVVRSTRREYKARAVIVASGSSPRKLDVPGENEFTGRGVSYCAVCDGPFFKDKDVVVVGGGDAAIEESLFLARLVNKVTVIHRRDQLRAAKMYQEKAMAEPKIEFLWNTVLREIYGKDKVEELLLENVATGGTSRMSTDGVFIFVGSIPATSFVQGLLDCDDKGCIRVDNRYGTTVKGIFAVGDVRQDSLRQIGTSVGDGVSAALYAEKYIQSIAA